jgi:serine/threonine-protein kinase
VAEESRFCASCGAALGDPTATGGSDPQRTELSVQHVAAGRSRSSSSHSSLDTARFAPGFVLAGRFRIVGLLGQGGMGEVYRAHDLKLGREVALKFLPEAYELDPRRLQLFLSEARLSLQVTHPNVCRVYDIAEVDGAHAISMEYVDGDDLASLLRRVGHFPEDKAVVVARQLCAGLAAAHEQGVLHRDLKPSNVLVDGRGQVKITDFGLAAPVDVDASDARAGTPAYMAPEQWSKSEVSIQSDVYALGLVLYELFTGRAAFHGKTPAEFAQLHRESEPSSPASLVDGLDPAVERVIMRCLEKDPQDRPRSARAVAAALPGGDPLAAALAAGETPSPELVARSTAPGGLSLRVAVLLLSLIVVGIPVLVRLGRDVQLPRSVPLQKSPEVLAERGRDLVRAFGPARAPVDEIIAYQLNGPYLDHIAHAAPQRDGWRALRQTQPSGLHFGYRSHSDRIRRVNKGAFGDWMDDPPVDQPGMTRVGLDLQGRLRALLIVPPVVLDSIPASPVVPDWGRLLSEAGFDAAKLTTAVPRWRPPVHADVTAAWDGTYPDSPSTSVRIEAASLGGHVVAFRVFEPWDRPSPKEHEAKSIWARISQGANSVFFLFVLVGAGVLARRNVRLGRGDRRGAMRFALYLGAVRLFWFIGAHHVPDAGETDLLISHLAWTMYRVGMVWVFYLAFEPYARRLWPRMLVSWVRVLGGHFRDPLVGRDVLISVAGGVIMEVVLRLVQWLPVTLGSASPSIELDVWPLEALRGARSALVTIAALHTNQTMSMMLGVLLFLVIRLLTRRVWAAVLTIAVFHFMGAASSPGNIVANLVGAVLIQVVAWLALFRLGFLVVILSASICAILNTMPLTFDVTAWYASASWLTLAILLGLAALALRIAVIGQPAGRTAEATRLA